MKKRTTIVLFATIVAGTAMLFTQCKSKEKTAAIPAPAGETRLIQYCSGPEYRSDGENFRATSVGESTNQQMSKRIARNMALEEISTQLNAFVSGVFDIHSKQIELTEDMDLTQRVEGMIRVSIDENIKGAHVICEEVTTTAQGRYKTYLAMELSASSILSAIERRISQEDETRIDFNYERFKETYMEEMQRLRDRRP